MPWVEKKESSAKQWEIITFTENHFTPHIYGDNTKDYAELYFSGHGLLAYPFEWIKETFSGRAEETLPELTEEILSALAINEEQKKYFQSLTNRTLPGHRWWDMVAVERHPEGERTAKVWLVDLKTHQVSIKNIKSLQKAGKMPNEKQIAHEKSLGFGHLIISVQLVTRRQVEVSCQEI
jgi:hypothetical protein